MKYPLGYIRHNQAREPTTCSEMEKSLLGERESISRVEVVDRTVSLSNRSFDVSASLSSSQRHGVSEGEIRSDCG